MTVEPTEQLMTEVVTLTGDELRIDGLTVDDHATVDLAREREAAGASLTELIVQAIEIGSRIIVREQTASDTEFVRAEFERQAREVEQQFTQSAEQVSTGLKERIDAAFATETGELPKLFEQHFGANSNSAVQNQVKALVDELLRSHREALTKQFTANDESNPLAQFQQQTTGIIKQAIDVQGAQLIEMNRVIAELQKSLATADAQAEGAAALAESEAAGTRKGRNYEEQVADAIADIAHRRGDSSERVGEKIEGGGKKGDVVVEIDAQRGPARGRIAFEAKDSRLSRPDAIKTLDEARRQRSASYAVLVVPSDEKAPAKFPPLEEIHGNKILVTFDAESGSTLVLETGYALARARVLMDSPEGDEIDAVAVRQAATRALDLLKSVSGIKRALTAASGQIATTSESVESLADELRAQLEEITALTRPAGENADEADQPTDA